MLRILLLALACSWTLSGFAEVIDYPDGARYEGELRNGKRHGHGRFTWPGGQNWYEGQYVDGQRQGKGTQLYNGHRYEGDFVAGKFQGKGALLFADGKRYEGDFVENRREGRGQQAWPDGQRYAGPFAGDAPHGRGVMTWAIGQRYEGEFVNGKPHGRGILTWADGARYDGEMADGMRQGKGVMVEADGRRYEGEWFADKRSGHGVERWTNGNVYEGGYLEGKRAGLGAMAFATGNRYEGGFLDDKFSGKGVYLWKNGTRYEGDFVANNFHGQGSMRWPDGDYYVGPFLNDKRQGPVQSARGGSSVDSGQMIAGAIGLGIIGSASGLSSAEKVRIASGFIGDVATDGKGQAMQSAFTDVRNSRLQTAEVQAVIERQRQLEQQRAAAAAAKPAVQPPSQAPVQSPVQVAAATPVKPAAPVPSPDFDALLREAPKTEKYSFTCARFSGDEMLPADVPGSCMAEQKRYMLIQCWPGWLMDESYIALRKCAAEKSRGKYKAEHQQRLDGAREFLRQNAPQCAPDGCSGKEHLGIL